MSLSVIVYAPRVIQLHVSVIVYTPRAIQLHLSVIVFIYTLGNKAAFVC